MEKLIELVTNLTFTSVLVGAAVGLAVYWVIQKMRYRKPPGPFAFPLIGNYKLLRDINIHRTCMEMAETYGPIVKIQIGPIEMIVLNSIEAVTEALIKRGSDFADRPSTTTLGDLSEGFKDIVFSPYSPTWKLHRKIVSKALRTYLKGDKLQEAVHTAITQAFKILEQQTEAFDPAEYCDFLVFNVISCLCYKQAYSIDNPEFKRLMKIDNDFFETFGIGTWEDIFPIIKKIRPTQKYRKIKCIIDESFDFINTKLTQHRETFDPDNIRDFTDSLLLARAEAEQEDDAIILKKLTDVHLRQTLSDIFFAGIDTSRFTLTWGILYMAGYPEMQLKCQKEIDTVVGRDRQIRLDDKQQLPYTDACLMEVMRLGNVVPIGIPHAALCDSQIGGYDIPKGTMILINHYAIHRDPKHWENPIKFDPNRYLDDQGNMKQKPDSWLPFSAGRRVCLGESLAKPELFTIFASLVHHFKIAMPPGVKPVFEVKGGAFNFVPKPYKIVFKKRI